MLICNKKWRLKWRFVSAIVVSIISSASFSTPLFAETSHGTANSTTKYAPTSVEMEIKKVSDHVYYVEGVPGIATDNEGFISNAGFIVTGDGVVVFDSLGTPSLANKLVHKIRSVTDQPIKKVIVSHFHADHIYGLQVFEELGAEIIAPFGAQKYINSEAAASRLEERQFSLEPWVNEDTHLVLPDVTVEKSYAFKLGEITFTINYMGKAHSDGDLTLLVEPDKVLFSGDIIFEGRIPFVGSADSKKWLETLTRLDTGGLSTLVPGHGPASNNPKETISLTRRYLAYLRKVMGTGIEDLSPFDEVYAEADWSEFKDLPAFEEGNRINAYQVYLSMEAELLEQ
jgi:glyoxylase-like metal-dependent hydrolase (beta-lactamase superfamily II)